VFKLNKKTRNSIISKLKPKNKEAMAKFEERYTPVKRRKIKILQKILGINLEVIGKMPNIQEQTVNLVIVRDFSEILNENINCCSYKGMKGY